MATPGYRAPAQQNLDEIKNLDNSDESLVKYKETLLAGTSTGSEDDPRNVVVTKMAVCVEGRDDIEMDLTGDLAKLKEKTEVLKEGCEFRLRIYFKVQNNIAEGLRYHHTILRKGISVDKQSYMVGSYGPKEEVHSFLAPVDEAPKGMMARGTYKVKSKFIDDDKNVHLQWEWNFEIKKDWE